MALSNSNKAVEQKQFDIFEEDKNMSDSEVQFCDIIEKLNLEHDEALTENAKLKKENEQLKQFIKDSAKKENDFMNEIWCSVMDLEKLHNEYYEPWIGNNTFGCGISNRTKVCVVNSLVSLRALTLGSIISFHKSRMIKRDWKVLKPLEEQFHKSITNLKDFLYCDRTDLATGDLSLEKYYEKSFEILQDYIKSDVKIELTNKQSKKSFKIFKF